MGKVTFELRGGAELDKLLEELPKRVATRLGRNAVNAGARVIAAEARRRAPVETGDLKKAIRVRSKRSRLPITLRLNSVEATAGVGGREGPLAHIIEFGTAPHRIVASPGKVLRFEVGGDVRFAKAVQHPGAAPKPFLRPAAESKAGAALQQIGDNLGKGIEREALKLGGRGP